MLIFRAPLCSISTGICTNQYTHTQLSLPLHPVSFGDILCSNSVFIVKRQEKHYFTWSHGVKQKEDIAVRRSENTPTGVMHLVGIVGCYLLIYVPLLTLLFISLRKRPQLIVIAMMGAFVAYLALMVTGALYLVLQSIPILSDNPASTYMIVVVHLMATSVLRALLFIILHRVECFAKSHGQVLTTSSICFASISAAVGCGFGSVASLHGGGAFLDATQRLNIYTSGTTAYNLQACPQFSMLEHSVLQSFMFFFCHISWSVMAGQGVVALDKLQKMQGGKRIGHCLFDYFLRYSCCFCCFHNDYSQEYESLDTTDSPVISCSLDKMTVLSPILPPESRDQGAEQVDDGKDPIIKEILKENGNVTLQREEIETARFLVAGEGNDSTGVAVPGLGGLKECMVESEKFRCGGELDPILPPEQLPEPTFLHRVPSVALMSIIGASIFQLAFSLTSVMNSIGLSENEVLQVPLSSGCVTSLGLQGVITTASFVAMGAIVKKESINRHAALLKH
ncbi:hypothetical protein TRVL_02771 [Trypanosoma vivax]|nr:hypothetical protein TRVL_02771 [Trypanosoma vivax]